MEQRVSAGTYYEHGCIQKRLHMYRQAITDFQKAGDDPRFSGKAQLQIALCYRAIGCLEEAIVAFRKAAHAPAVTDEEQRHILYQVGQLLEKLGRRAESVEVYGRIRREDAEFRDVTQRIRRLIASGAQTSPHQQGTWSRWITGWKGEQRGLRPRFAGMLNQAGQWLGQQVRSVPPAQPLQKVRAETSGIQQQSVMDARGITPPKSPVRRTRAAEQRRHTRVSVCLTSRFSVKRGEEASEGVLRDLSPWGCRMVSFSAVSVGERVECCIYPQGTAHPFTIEGATVCWIKGREFGLAFTSVRPGVQKQLAQVCRLSAA